MKQHAKKRRKEEVGEIKHECMMRLGEQQDTIDRLEKELEEFEEKYNDLERIHVRAKERVESGEAQKFTWISDVTPSKEIQRLKAKIEDRESVIEKQGNKIRRLLNQCTNSKIERSKLKETIQNFRKDEEVNLKEIGDLRDRVKNSIPKKNHMKVLKSWESARAKLASELTSANEYIGRLKAERNGLLEKVQHEYEAGEIRHKCALEAMKTEHHLKNENSKIIRGLRNTIIDLEGKISNFSTSTNSNIEALSRACNGWREAAEKGMVHNGTLQTKIKGLEKEVELSRHAIEHNLRLLDGSTGKSMSMYDMIADNMRDGTPSCTMDGERGKFVIRTVEEYQHQKKLHIERGREAEKDDVLRLLKQDAEQMAENEELNDDVLWRVLSFLDLRILKIDHNAHRNPKDSE